ncbi:MAG: hypothetical protein WDW38_011080 [Sanguina aurantia]
MDREDRRLKTYGGFGRASVESSEPLLLRVMRAREGSSCHLGGPAPTSHAGHHRRGYGTVVSRHRQVAADERDKDDGPIRPATDPGAASARPAETPGAYRLAPEPGSDRPGSGLGASSGDAGRLPARSPNQAATDPGAASARQAETPGAYRLAPRTRQRPTRERPRRVKRRRRAPTGSLPGANQPWSGCGSETIPNQAATDPGAASARQAETPGAYRLAPGANQPWSGCGSETIPNQAATDPGAASARQAETPGAYRLAPGANQPWSGCGSETIPVYANILHTVENKPGSDRPGSGLGASSGDAGRLPARSPNQAATDPGAASARQAETPGAYRLAPGANQPWSGCGSETIPVYANILHTVENSEDGI